MRTKILTGNTAGVSNYRPCYVKKHKALFHRWEDKSWVVAASPMVGGTPAGQIKMTIGIVEYEDGSVHECYPDEIRFCDPHHNEYCFDIKEIN